MKPEEIAALRGALGLDRSAFARIVGVDTRSVYRWEMGEVQASGAALAVLRGFAEVMKGSGGPALRARVERVAGLGCGLALLLVELFDDLTRRAAS